MGTKARRIALGPSPTGGRSSVRRLAIEASEWCWRRQTEAGGCKVRTDSGPVRKRRLAGYAGRRRLESSQI